MFTAVKDAMSSKAAQSFVNARFERYGKVLELKIDSKRKTVAVVCLLHGEPEPITLSVGKYIIEEVGGKKYIWAADCTCSRPWLQRLVADFAEGKRVELPGWASAAL